MNFSDTDLLIIVTTFVILTVVLMMVSLYGIFIKKKSALLLDQQRQIALYDQELAIAQVEIKEQTLNYIGQELHDDLGQKLSVARLMTNKISSPSNADEKEIAMEINSLLGECIQDIRNLSKVFITKQVEYFGFVESLEREVFRIKRLNLLEVDYEINNPDLDINSDHALILFRIVQECITNVIKHSKSKKIELKVVETPNNIRIFVNDNGVGFESNIKNDGSGLQNMKSRANIINAEFHIDSVLNKGTKIKITYKK